jgi:anti-anti-sigma factor
LSSREQDRGIIAAALSEARRSRTQGRLKAAVEALDKAIPLCQPDDANAARALADESSKLGATLLEKGSVLAALSEFARVLDLQAENPAAREGLDRCVQAYERWAPPMGAVAPGNQLIVGATGAFWVNRAQRGRVVVLQGGINGETVPAGRKALEVAGQGASWLLLDMKKLAYVGSTGLAATVKVAETLEKAGGGLVLYQVASNLAIVINTLGLGRYLRVVADLVTALAHARGQHVAAPSDD